MILVDAVYLNSKGGKLLLKLIINELFNKKNIFYLLDERLKNDFPELKKKTKFLQPSLIKRHIFYKKNKNKFTRVLAFSSLPPTVKLECDVITFFQNVLLIEKNSFSFKLLVKKIIWSFFTSNTDQWVVQTESVKSTLKNKLKLKHEIIVLPIFDNLNSENFNKSKLIKKECVKFLYVSSGEKYKNHCNLINSFLRFNKKYPKSSLTLTIDKKYTSLNNKLNQLQEFNIINRGNVERKALIIEYKNADIFVFPSKKESFGLGLIEASQFKLPIIASNLPYVHSVIKPTLTFDPNDEDDIFDKMMNFNYNNYELGQLKVKNRLNDLINLILK